MAEDILRLSGPTLKVLKFFVERLGVEQSGADITREARIGAGTLYPMLARLEKAGWLSSAWEEINPSEAGRPRRRFYRLTGAGHSRALKELSQFQMPLGELAWRS